MKRSVYVLCVVCLVWWASLVWAYLTDSSSHPPPTSGTYNFNAFTPPTLGNTYVDPVFGETIRRVSAVGEIANYDDIYAHHWANANGTYMFRTGNTATGALSIINTTTGAELWGSQPVGSSALAAANIQWHPTNPDKYQYINSGGLVERTLSTQTETTFFNLATHGGGTFNNYGGSLPWVDGTGEYYLIGVAGTVRVWKRSTDTLYTGSTASFAADGGWISITPDAKYVVTSAGNTATPNKEHYAYAIDHNTQSVSTTPIQFWGLCGDHGVLASASDGHNYFITFACHATNPGLYRVDITLNQAGRTEAQQQADNVYLLPLNWNDNDGHLSGNMIGTLKDWIFFDSECFVEDTFGSAPTPWRAFKQEIMAINVVTLEVRRLAHHRSRSLAASYYYQPHVSSSWDGHKLLFMSNMNDSTPADYTDAYSIDFNPTGGGSSTGGSMDVKHVPQRNELARTVSGR